MSRRLTWHDLPQRHKNVLNAKEVTAPRASEAEELFLFHVKMAALPLPVREHRFSQTGRKWRFDFAWLERKLAVEIEGLTHATVDQQGKKRLGRHQTIKGFTGDCEKYNQAALEGWMVLHFTPRHVKNGYAMITLKNALLGPSQ